MQRLIQRKVDSSAWDCPNDMPPMIHELLKLRGISSQREAEAFLHPNPNDLHDPMLLSGMREAAPRVKRAVDEGEAICIFGDYDVDGVSATSVLILYLRSLGANVEAYIPSRHEEGYGLNERAVREIALRCKLLITVDCGISCLGEVRLARELGMDVIVTDHHRPGNVLPDCVVVNPLLEDYPFPYLCGTGVAFKLVQAIASLAQSAPADGLPAGWATAREYIDLAALATVADIVPLADENRVLVALGLQKINASPRAGMAALIHEAGLEGRRISAMNIAFQLAPRLNASGRLGDARRAMALLTADSELSAAPIAQELEGENSARREQEQKIVRDALEQMKQYDLLFHRIIVLMGEDWNAGVIGLAASRLVTEYHYPVILLSVNGEICTGSCRSIPGVDIFSALSTCADLMMRFGGHRQAAGLTMEKRHVAELIERLDEYLRTSIEPDMYIPEMEYDLQLPLNQVTEEAVRQMELLQPTGFGNPSPVLLSEVTVDMARTVGRDGAHLKMTLSEDGCVRDAICFGAGHLASELHGTTRNMLYAPSINVWRDRVSVQCEVKDLPDAQLQEIFASFEKKYPRDLRAYLTEILYNSVLNSPIRDARRAEREDLKGWLRFRPQGTAIAVVTREGAHTLKDFLCEENLLDRLDGCIGRWNEDIRAFNSVFFCPRGQRGARCERVVLWDAPKEAFASLPEGELYEMNERPAVSWMDEIPTVDRLREFYVHARAIARTGSVSRMTGEEIERLIARDVTGASDIEAMFALAVLRSMRLIAPEREKLSLLEMRRIDPLDDPLMRRLAMLRGDAMSGK